MGLFHIDDDEFDPKWLDPNWKDPRTPEQIEAESKAHADMLRKFQSESLRIDKLYGKIIPGAWSPLGSVRDPETADDPNLAKALNKRL